MVDWYLLSNRTVYLWVTKSTSRSVTCLLPNLTMLTNLIPIYFKHQHQHFVTNSENLKASKYVCWWTFVDRNWKPSLIRQIATLFDSTLLLKDWVVSLKYVSVVQSYPVLFQNYSHFRHCSTAFSSSANRGQNAILIFIEMSSKQLSGDFQNLFEINWKLHGILCIGKHCHVCRYL